MPRRRRILSFFNLLVVIIGSAHYYVFARLTQDLALSGWARRLSAMLIGSLFVLSVAILPLSRLLPRRAASPLAWLAFSWLGVLMVLLPILLVSDVGLFLWHLLWGWPTDSVQQALLLRRTGSAVLVAAMGVSGLALWNARHPVKVKPLAVTLRRLPREFHGFRIVQLTDLHVGPTINGVWLRRVVERTNRLAADIIVITGDLVDGSVDELREYVAPLRDLRARYGVFFVTGNHEYYSGADKWIAHLRHLGIQVLRNERVTLHVNQGKGGPSIDLAGVDDLQGYQFRGHGPDLAKALAGRDAERPVILLAHQPAVVKAASAHRVDLQLSGHTHGGQIWPWIYLVRLQQPYISGLHRFGDTQIYISRGTGYWGPPMRLGAPAEITLITLYAYG